MATLEQPSRTEPKSPEEEFGAKVRAWLAEKDAGLDRLVDWLQGYDLPSEAYGVEPYLWLMKALPVDADRGDAKVRLAERVAAVLSEQPNIEPGVQRRADEFLENLLLLCACLKCPDQLCEPLFSLYSRNCEHPSANLATPVVQSALRSALVLNQADERLEPVWSELIQGREDRLLPSSRYAAYDGLVFKPMSASTRGRPDLHAIARGLRRMADFLEQRKDRRDRLRKLVNRAIAAYPGRQTWGLDLLSYGLKAQLPQWAVTSLPSLCVFPSESQAVVWNPILACVPDETNFHVRPRQTYSEVGIVEAEVSPRARDYLCELAKEFEARRVGNPWKSNKSQDALAVESIAAIVNAPDESAFFEPLRTAERMRKHREKLEALYRQLYGQALRRKG